MNYILYGEQFPMIKKRLQKILLERLGKPDDFNVAKFDFEECELSEIIDEASLLPLGYERKAVVVDHATFLGNAGNKEAREKILEIVRNSSDEIDIILIHRSGTIDDKCELVKEIKEHGQIINLMNLKKNDWPIYIKKYFDERSVQIDQNAIDELCVRVNGDLSLFRNEASKLCLYKDHITLSDVLLMVSKPLEDDVFCISNALFNGDNALAVSIFRDLQKLGSKSTDTLIPMLGTQFRFISEVTFLDEKGLSTGQIAQQLGCSEGRVYMSLKNAKFLSRRQIAHVLDDLYQLDCQIKSGQIDRFYGFELFLINFPN